MKIVKWICLILSCIFYLVTVIFWIFGPETIQTVIFLSGIAAVTVMCNQVIKAIDNLND